MYLCFVKIKNMNNEMLDSLKCLKIIDSKNEYIKWLHYNFIQKYLQKGNFSWYCGAISLVGTFLLE
jgi:hypothetical protein